MMRQVLIGMLLLVASGCGVAPPAGPVIAPAKGKLTWDAKPLSGAMVRFVPEGDTPGWGAAGISGEDGSYQLIEKSGGQGVPPGEYRVIVSRRTLPDGTPVPPNDPTPPADSPAIESLPPEYSDPTTTKLRATVPEQGGTFDFALPMR